MATCCRWRDFTLAFALACIACGPRLQRVTLPPCRAVSIDSVNIGESQPLGESRPKVSGYATGDVVLHVVDEHGMPFANLAMWLISPSYSQGYSAEPKAGGVYVFRNVPAVESEIRIADCSYPSKNDLQIRVRVAEGNTTPVTLVVRARP